MLLPNQEDLIYVSHEDSFHFLKVICTSELGNLGYQEEAFVEQYYTNGNPLQNSVIFGYVDKMYLTSCF